MHPALINWKVEKLKMLVISFSSPVIPVPRVLSSCHGMLVSICLYMPYFSKSTFSGLRLKLKRRETACAPSPALMT